MAESNPPSESANGRKLGPIALIIGACGRRPGLVIGITLALAVLGGASALSTPLDALPDLTDTQVIIATEWMGRGPTLIEDQITYPRPRTTYSCSFISSTPPPTSRFAARMADAIAVIDMPRA